MTSDNTIDRTMPSNAISWLVLIYTLASLQHFTHNAEFVDAYPNLPVWISRSSIYLSWLAIAAIGAFGYALLRFGRDRAGLTMLALYACLGFDGLLHYTRAPFAAHTLAMNLTILIEVVAAAALLIAVIVRVLEQHRWRIV